MTPKLGHPHRAYGESSTGDVAGQVGIVFKL